MKNKQNILSELECMQVLEEICQNYTKKSWLRTYTNYIKNQLLPNNTSLPHTLWEKLLSNVQNIEIIWDCYLAHEALTLAPSSKINTLKVQYHKIKNVFSIKNIVGNLSLTHYNLTPVTREETEDKTPFVKKVTYSILLDQIPYLITEVTILFHASHLETTFILHSLKQVQYQISMHHMGRSLETKTFYFNLKDENTKQPNIQKPISIDFSITYKELQLDRSPNNKNNSILFKLSTGAYSDLTLLQLELPIKE